MVWGMGTPSNFGDFFPEGDYAGWRDGLLQYFRTEMPAERRAKFANALMYPLYVTFKFNRSTDWEGNSEVPPFSPIEPHERPTRFTLQKEYKSLGSLFLTTGSIWVVDESLKAIIERFEAAKHQFFPLEISTPDATGDATGGGVNRRRYYILVIGQYIDCFSSEQSDPTSWRKSERGSLFFRDVNNSMSGLALSKKAFDAAHLWRERRLTSELVCFSDALMSEIRAAGLRLPKHHRLKEV